MEKENSTPKKKKIKEKIRETSRLKGGRNKRRTIISV